MNDLGELVFACIDCGSRHQAQQACNSCGAQGPLMDLTLQDVRLELLNEDSRRRDKRSAQMIWAAVPFAALTTVVLAWMGFGLWIGLAAGAGAGYGVSRLLARVFPAQQRFPYLTS